MRRKHISLAVKLEVALLQLGLDPKRVRLDHHPPLALRPWRKAPDGTIVYSPDENDPRYLQWLSIEDHAVKTTGQRGTSKLSKRGGDISEIAKAKRIAERRAQDERFTYAAAIAEALTGEEYDPLFVPAPMADQLRAYKALTKLTKPKRSWPKRSFPKRAKPERTHGQRKRR